MHPCFPRHLLITDVTLLRGVEPYQFALTITGMTSGELVVHLSSEALLLLTLADGTRTCDEILSEITDVTPHFTASELELIIEHLRRQKLLLDATTYTPCLSSDRYSRHALFFSLFSDLPSVAQDRISQSTVAVVGVGGIGTWISYLLVAAGVGHLHLFDDDAVEVSNLTRQMLFDTEDVGVPKVFAARDRLTRLNPAVTVSCHKEALGSDNATLKVLSGTDLIVVSADNPLSLKDHIDALSIETGTPWTSCGYRGATGLIGPLFIPGRTGCLKCAHIDATRMDSVSSMPLVATINKRFQPPSFGPLNGIVAAMTAGDVIAYLAGLPCDIPSLGTLITFDLVGAETAKRHWKRRSDCSRCGHLTEPANVRTA